MSKPKPKQPAKQAKASKKAKASTEVVKKSKKAAVAEVQAPPSEITVTDAKVLHEQAKTAALTVQESFVTLGRALAPIRINSLFIRKELGGYKNFEEYVQGELSGLDVSQAYRSVQLFEFYSKIGADMDKVASIGVSKALILTKLADEDSLDKWLEKAEEETVEKLSSYLKKSKKNVGGQKVTIGKFVIRAQDEQIANIEYAVNEARQILGLGKEAKESNAVAAAMDLICTEWLQTHLPRGESALHWKEVLERVYQGAIEVVIKGDLVEPKKSSKKVKVTAEEQHDEATQESAA